MDNHHGSNLFKTTHFYAGIEGGANYQSFNRTINTTLVGVPTDKERYSINGESKFNGDLAVRAGVITPLSPRFSLQWGAAYQYDFSQTINGNYDQAPDVDPTQDDNITYHLKIQSLLGEGRLYYQTTPRLALFAGGGIGIDSIRSSSVSFTDNTTGVKSPTALPSRAITKKHTAYEALAGLNYALSNRWHVELGASHEWLGDHSIDVNEGTTSNPSWHDINMGSINPWKAWIGLNVRF
jgi:hypothetical protein